MSIFQLFCKYVNFLFGANCEFFSRVYLFSVSVWQFQVADLVLSSQGIKRGEFFENGRCDDAVIRYVAKRGIGSCIWGEIKYHRQA